MISTMELITMASISEKEAWGGEMPPSIPWLRSAEAAAPYYRFLNKVVRYMKPQVVLECGVYLGVATAHLAAGNPGTLVIGIDKELHPNALTVETMFSNIRLIVGDTTAEETLSLILDVIYHRRIGLLFLDSEHDGITPQTEFDLYKSLFADECVVACDDILDSRMHDFWENLPGEKLVLNALHTAQYKGYPNPGFGVSIVRKNASL